MELTEQHAILLVFLMLLICCYISFPHVIETSIILYHSHRVKLC